MHFYRVVLLAAVSLVIGLGSLLVPAPVRAQQPQQPQPRVVEDVDIIGNRRLRKEDILYYIQTHPGDVYNEAQIARDLQTILALGFFDKVGTRVTTEDGPRGGVRVIFEVVELPIIRDIQFEGLKSVAESDVLKTFREKRVGVSKEAILDPVKVRNAERAIKEMLASKGHPNAVVTANIEKVSATSSAITFVVNEGARVRVGEIHFEGGTHFKSAALRSRMKNVKKAYGTQGFIQYTADVNPTFKDSPQNANEGIADFVITIDEGKQFTLRRLEFTGNTFTRDNVLRREVLVNEGDIYNQQYFEYSVTRLNQLGYFNPIDKDKDADFRTNEEEGLVDVTVKVSEKGRQQISFNGGISGIGGSFFGLEYSTNNLFGRGEVLSVNLAAGNRQRSFQFSFTEPYIKNRPISAGFTLFAYSQKFFGEGTFLSQNTNAQQGLLGSTFDFFNTSEENLFTRNSTGCSIFASAPVSEFYRKRPFTPFSPVGP